MELTDILMTVVLHVCYLQLRTFLSLCLKLLLGGGR